MESFIRTYKVPHSVCDRFVRIFHHNEHLAQPGNSGMSEKWSKISSDIGLTPEQLENITPFNNIFTNSILDFFRVIDYNSPIMMYEGCNIQYYKSGQGFYKIHYENGQTDFPTSLRLLVWMLYLTDTPNAGTCFPKQNYITECTKGDLIIWPAGFTHPHYGIISDEHEKMIITGWVHRCIPSNMDVIDETLKETLEEDEETL